MNCGNIGGLAALPTNTSGLIHSAKEYVNGQCTYKRHRERVGVYNGVYHNWSRKHRTKYINEFTFRINSGNCTIDTTDRMIAVVKGTNSNRRLIR